MKNDLRKAWTFMKFGICVNKGLNIGCMLIFMIIGIVGELYYLMSGWNIYSVFDMFAFLLLAAVSFPAQFIVTMDIAQAVQTSPYKKNIQTKMFAKVSLISNLLMMTLLVLTRVIVGAIHPQDAAKYWSDLPVCGMMACIVLAFTVLMYKYFWVAMIILYVIVFTISGFGGYLVATGDLGGNIFHEMPVAGNILIGYLFVVLGAGIAYLLSLAFYKKPFSKSAFGTLMSKYM